MQAMAKIHVNPPVIRMLFYEFSTKQAGRRGARQDQLGLGWASNSFWTQRDRPPPSQRLDLRQYPPV